MLVNLMEEEIYEEAEFRCDAEEDVDTLFDDVLDEIVRAMRKDGAFRKKLGETLFDGSHMASILQSDIDSAITSFATEYLRSKR
jgi:chemotaxis receptor (MCP) glutamine deamidase CheD